MILPVIQEAMNKDPVFKRKLSYWIHTRQRMPDLWWLNKQIMRILGRQRVEEILIETKRLTDKIDTETKE